MEDIDYCCDCGDEFVEIDVSEFAPEEITDPELREMVEAAEGEAPGG